MSRSYVVDWQQGEEKVVGGLVSVRLRGRAAGLYRIKRVQPGGVLLSHGAISFPVGTQLDIDVPQAASPQGWRHARVIANDARGVDVAW